MHGYYREKLHVNHFYYQQPLGIKVRKTTLLNTHLLQDLVLPLSLGVKRTMLVLYSKLHSSHIVHQIWEESYHRFESCGEKTTTHGEDAFMLLRVLILKWEMLTLTSCCFASTPWMWLPIRTVPLSQLSPKDHLLHWVEPEAYNQVSHVTM